MGTIDQMNIRYSSIEELLEIARKSNMIIRSNSLAGVFYWTPDKFEQERNAGKFPAKCDVCNFWLQPFVDFRTYIFKKLEIARKEVEAIEKEIREFQL